MRLGRRAGDVCVCVCVCVCVYIAADMIIMTSGDLALEGS